MRIDFGNTADQKILNMNGGTGEMTARMYADADKKVIPCRIHPGGSIGLHVHEHSEEIDYVLYGNGVATCDGVEEPLSTDICHICPVGASHSIVNTGVTDLVMLTVVIEK